MEKKQSFRQKHYIKQMQKIENLPKQHTSPLKCFSINTKTIEDNISSMKSTSFIIDSRYESQFEHLLNKYLKNQNISYKRKFLTALAILLSASLLTAEGKAKNINNEAEIQFGIANDLLSKNEEIINQVLNINYTHCNLPQTGVKTSIESLSTPEVLERIEKNRIAAQYDVYLEEYSSYFNLDSEKVISLAREATNNYEESFDKVIINDKYDLTNPEAACMLFVYELQVKRNNSKIDFNRFSSPVENLKISEEIKTIPHTNLGTLILENGYSFPNYIEKICCLFGLENVAGYDGTIATLSLSFIEAGETTGSPASHERNNFFGMTGKTDLLNYATPESCIISTIGNLFNNYNRSNDLDKLAWKYNRVPKNLEQWKINFCDAYYRIENNYEEYFKEEPNKDSSKRSLIKKEES